MAKKEEKVVEEVAAEPTPVKGGDAKKAFAEMIARYKEENPAKYELKKERLEAKLKAM